MQSVQDSRVSIKAALCFYYVCKGKEQSVVSNKWATFHLPPVALRPCPRLPGSSKATAGELLLRKLPPSGKLEKVPCAGRWLQGWGHAPG